MHFLLLQSTCVVLGIANALYRKNLERKYEFKSHPQKEAREIYLILVGLKIATYSYFFSLF